MTGVDAINPAEEEVGEAINVGMEAAGEAAGMEAAEAVRGALEEGEDGSKLAPLPCSNGSVMLYKTKKTQTNKANRKLN